MPDGELTRHRPRLTDEELGELYKTGRLPWEALQRAYADVYPADEFWAWLKEYMPEGYDASRKIGGMSIAGLEGYLRRSFDTFRQPPIEPTPMEAMTIEDWLASLSPEEEEARQSEITEMQARSRMLTGSDLTPDQLKALDEYLFAMFQAMQGAVTEEDRQALEGLSEAELSAELERLLAEKEEAMARVEVPEAIRDITDPERYQAKIDEKMRVLSVEPFGAFMQAQYPDLAPELNIGMQSHLRRLVEFKMREAEVNTGKRISNEEALNRITDTEWRNIEDRAMFTFSYALEKRGKVPRPGTYDALHEVATSYGMSDVQYLMSAFQTHKRTQPAEYLATKSLEEQWYDFLNPVTHKTGERDSLLGHIEADIQLFSGQKRGLGLPTFERVPYMPEPELAELAERIEERPIEWPMKWEEVEKPAEIAEITPAYAGEPEIGAEQAQISFRSILGATDPTQLRYAMQFFPTLWQEFGTGTGEDWRKFLEQYDISQFLPKIPSPMPKTRFVK